MRSHAWSRWLHNDYFKAIFGVIYKGIREITTEPLTIAMLPPNIYWEDRRLEGVLCANFCQYRCYYRVVITRTFDLHKFKYYK